MKDKQALCQAGFLLQQLVGVKHRDDNCRIIDSFYSKWTTLVEIGNKCITDRLGNGIHPVAIFVMVNAGRDPGTLMQ